LFDALFKPHSGGRLARPRAMPEPIALHYTWQLVQDVSCLHAQAHFHRDLKVCARARVAPSFARRFVAPFVGTFLRLVRSCVWRSLRT